MNLIKSIVLLVLLALTNNIQKVSSNQLPLCYPEKSNDEKPNATRFVFVVDDSLKNEQYLKLIYLYKALTCFIPNHDDLWSMAAHLNQSVIELSPFTKSIEIPFIIYKDSSYPYEPKIVSLNKTIDTCARFLTFLKSLNDDHLNHPNVQFIVPVLNQTNCSLLEQFQQVFRNSTYKKNIGLNAIFIGKSVDERIRNVTRLHISNIDQIDHKDKYMQWSPDIRRTRETSERSLKLKKFIQDAINGIGKNSWMPKENESTTTTTTTTTTTSIPPIDQLNSTAQNETQLVTNLTAQNETQLVTNLTAQNETQLVTNLTAINEEKNLMNATDEIWLNNATNATEALVNGTENIVNITATGDGLVNKAGQSSLNGRNVKKFTSEWIIILILAAVSLFLGCISLILCVICYCPNKKVKRRKFTRRRARVAKKPTKKDTTKSSTDASDDEILHWKDIKPAANSENTEDLHVETPQSPALHSVPLSNVEMMSEVTRKEEQRNALQAKRAPREFAFE